MKNQQKRFHLGYPGVLAKPTISRDPRGTQGEVRSVWQIAKSLKKRRPTGAKGLESLKKNAQLEAKSAYKTGTHFVCIFCTEKTLQEPKKTSRKTPQGPQETLASFNKPLANTDKSSGSGKSAATR